MVVLQSVTKLCPGVTGFMHSHKKCIRTKERDKVEKRSHGKSKLKVSTVAGVSRENVECHIGGVKREDGLAVFHCVALYNAS